MTLLWLLVIAVSCSAFVIESHAFVRVYTTICKMQYFKEYFILISYCSSEVLCVDILDVVWKW